MTENTLPTSNPTADEMLEELKSVEGVRGYLYYDTAAERYLTHGVGINLEGKNNEFLTAYINNLYKDTNPKISVDTLVDHYVYSNGVWSVEKNADGSNKQGRLLDEIKHLRNLHVTNRSVFPYAANGIPDTEETKYLRLKVTEAQAEQAFKEIVYDAYLNSKYGINGVITSVNNIIIGGWDLLKTEAKKVLYSLNYNKSSLIGRKLVTALSQDNWAEAWYEIRYQSNANNKPGKNKDGITERRIQESDDLGKMCPNISEDQNHKNLYTMFQGHRKTIEGYEQRWSNHFSGTNSIQSQLSSSYTYLIHTYGFGRTDIAWNEIYIGDASKESSAVNSLFLGDNKNNKIIAGNGNDVLHGGDGRDEIQGGGGNDILVGGKGYDTLKGGSGADTYKFDLGDGYDVAFGEVKVWQDVNIRYFFQNIAA